MKNNLIKFLKQRTTTFTIEEMNAIINTVDQLEEPQTEEDKKGKKK